MQKIYKHIYDNPKDQEGNDKPNELLGEFNVIYGDMNDYSFSVVVVDKDENIFNLVGDEVSGRYGNPKAGTVCRLVPVILHRPHVA